MNKELNNIAFMWDNFGPMHVDRCEAVANKFGPGKIILGIELFSESDTYLWTPESGSYFEKKTLFENRNWIDTPAVLLAFSIVKLCFQRKVEHVFLCNYDRPGIFLAAIALRLSLKRVYIMGCSKFDDKERNVWKELAKSIFLLPYFGGIASQKRSMDYMRFLGVKSDRVKGQYNTLSVERIRRLSGKVPAPGGTAFADRHFTVVARFVPKKNLAIAIKAYALFLSATKSTRQLHICGSGPLEPQLRQMVAELGLSNMVIFRGFLQTQGIAQVLGDTLALVLPSIEEQFGNVVIESQALGLPVILSDNCGAKDYLIQSGVNGFVVEPDNEKGFAIFMKLLAEDEGLWRSMCEATNAFVDRGDVGRFVEAVEELVNI